MERGNVTKMNIEDARVDINEAWCKGCEICVEVCPKNVLVMNDFVAKVIDIKSCTGCLLCEQLCPKHAISTAENG